MAVENKYVTVKPLEKKRLTSLDALRGFDMFWIVCGEYIFHGIAQAIKQKHGLTQSTTDWQITTSHSLSFVERIMVGISNQLHHSVWDGFTFYDLIFPLFIFIAGVSMPYSIGNKLNEAGADRPLVRKNIYHSLIKRTVILIVLGMLVNGVLRFNGYENTRIASVLGRIGLSCFFAALIYMKCSPKKQIAWFVTLLIGYFVIMMLVPVPGFGAGVLTPEGNLAAYIDRQLLPGKLHRQVYDPEGLLSTIPAIGSTLLGVFVGQFLQSSAFTNNKKTFLLFTAGAILLVAGRAWSLIFPINKILWSSSYVLFAGGWSMMLLALFFYIIDTLQIKRWCVPFIWLGTNSILIYVAAHGLVNFEATSQFLFGGLINRTPELWHNAWLWVGVAIVQFAVLWFLYKKKIFWKI